MADQVVFKRVYNAYIDNEEYHYPDQDTYRASEEINTGWQVIPSFLWGHFATPKHVAEMNVAYEAFKVDGYKVTLFNLIPMTSQPSIQRTNFFTAFNNCLYVMGATDNNYETNWHDWWTTVFKCR